MQCSAKAVYEAKLTRAQLNRAEQSNLQQQRNSNVNMESLLSAHHLLLDTRIRVMAAVEPWRQEVGSHSICSPLLTVMEHHVHCTYSHRAASACNVLAQQEGVEAADLTHVEMRCQADSGSCGSPILTQDVKQLLSILCS